MHGARHHLVFVRRLGLAVSFALLCAGFARTDQASSTAPAAAESPALRPAGERSRATPARPDRGEPRPAPDAGLRGQVVYLDPETGKLRSDPPEGSRWPVVDPAFARSVSSSHEDVRIYDRPDGSRVAGRPGGFRSALMATVGEDGSVRLTHVSGSAPAQAADPVEEDDDAR